MSSGGGNYPTWMNVLFGESLVLSASEWRLLVKVLSMAQKEFGVNTSSIDRGVMSQELSSLVNSLGELVYYLKTCEKSNRVFRENYEQWRPIRNKNIDILRDIADVIQQKKKVATTGRAVGSCASLLGGVVTLAFRSHPVTAMAAFGLGLLGGIFVYGASSAEKKIIEEKIAEAEDIVRKDRKHFDAMWSWFVNASELQTTMDEIFIKIHRTDTPNRLWGNATGEIESFLIVEKKSKDTDLEMLIKKMLNSIKISQRFQEEICDVVTVIMAILMLGRHHCSLLRSASKGSKIKSQLDAFKRELDSALGLSFYVTSVEHNSAKRVDAILTILSEFYKLVHLTSEIVKGYPNEECEKVKKIANIFEREIYELEKMYYDI